jgi:hypothetical protein
MNNMNKGWICQNCGRENRAESRFCSACGTENKFAAAGVQAVNVAEIPKKKRKWPIVLALLLVLALAAGAAFFLLRGKDKAAEPSTETEVAEESTEAENPNAAVPENTEAGADNSNAVNPNAADPSDENKGPENTKAVSAKASSVRAQIDNFTYEADKAIDNKRDTAWVEGVSGPGEGESISLTFDNLYPIEGIYIENGYQKSAETYNGNYRVKDVILRFGDGSEESCTLQDYKDGGQIIVLSEPKDTSRVTVEIASAYAGNDKDVDTCITEIRLADKSEIEGGDAPKIKAKAK